MLHNGYARCSLLQALKVSYTVGVIIATCVQYVMLWFLFQPTFVCGADSTWIMNGLEKLPYVIVHVFHMSSVLSASDATIFQQEGGALETVCLDYLK